MFVFYWSDQWVQVSDLILKARRIWYANQAECGNPLLSQPVSPQPDFLFDFLSAQVLTSKGSASQDTICLTLLLWFLCSGPSSRMTFCSQGSWEVVITCWLCGGVCVLLSTPPTHPEMMFLVKYV